VKNFDAEHVLPSSASAVGLGKTFEIATRENMNTSIPVDFTGLWWIRCLDDPVVCGTSRSFCSLYRSLRLEEGLTFAGMTSNTTGEPWFLAQLSAQTNMQHRWMFSNSLAGRIAMIAVGFTGASENKLNMVFYNRTNGRIGSGSETIIWPIDKIDEDQWLRKTIWTDIGGVPVSNMNYILTRIVNADGTPHPVLYQKWLKHVHGWQVRVFNTNDDCMRKCGSLTHLRGVCKQRCSESS